MGEVINMLFDRKEQSVFIGNDEISMNETASTPKSDLRTMAEKPSKVVTSNLLIPISYLSKGELKAGKTEQGSSYLVKTPKYKMLFSFDEVGASVKLTLDCDLTNLDPELFAVCAFVHMLGNTEYMPSTRKLLAEEDCVNSPLAQKKNRLFLIMDNFYYEMKRKAENLKSLNVLMTYTAERDANKIEQAFSKASGLEPISLEPGLRYLSDGAENIPFVMDTQPVKATCNKTQEDKRYDKVKNGEYRLFEDEFLFDDEAYNAIPPLEELDAYIPTTDFYEILDLAFIQCCEAFGHSYAGRLPSKKLYARQMRKSEILNLLLFGPPGTGKSTMPRAVAAALGIPFRSVTGTPDSDENSFNLQVMFSEDGNMSYFEQQYRRAYRTGGIIQLDEVNLIRPDVLQGVFSSALDGNHRLGNLRTNNTTVEGRGFAERAASTICTFTCNPGAAGTKLQNTAFYSRIAVWKELKDIKKEDLFEVVRKQYADVSDKIMEGVYDVYSTLRRSLSKEMCEMKEYQDLISPRSFLYCIGMYMNGMELGDAINNSMVNNLKCLVSEKGEDTFDEFTTKILDPVKRILSNNKVYSKKIELTLI